MKNQNSGWVYFIKSGRYLKIGITKESIRKRMGNYATHNPYQVIIKELIFVKSPEKIEKFILDKYCKNNKTEWFKSQKNIEIDIINLMMNFQEKNKSIPDYKRQLLNVVYKQNENN